LKRCEERTNKSQTVAEVRQSYLSWFDFVLVVILKNAFITQTQPPWDALLILRERARERKREH